MGLGAVMVASVHEAFELFDKYITAANEESVEVKAHRASILATLRANFGVARFFRVGSYGTGTAVRGFSDVDYFATIPSNYMKPNSDSMLQSVAYVLATRFPDLGIAVRNPAVVVPFGKDPSEWTEVFPVRFLEEDVGQYLVYQIADGRGGWKRTIPDAHATYIAAVDKRLRNMVRPLIRFVKAWKYYRNAQISSFYLELWVGRYASGEAAIVYGLDMKNVLLRLLDEGLAPLSDPLGVTGDIAPCSDESRRADALLKLQASLELADKASDAESRGDIEEAIQWWDSLYVGAFKAAMR
jgi:hypothetical protein